MSSLWVRLRDPILTSDRHSAGRARKTSPRSAQSSAKPSMPWRKRTGKLVSSGAFASDRGECALAPCS